MEAYCFHYLLQSTFESITTIMDPKVVKDILPLLDQL